LALLEFPHLVRKGLEKVHGRGKDRGVKGGICEEEEGLLHPPAQNKGWREGNRTLKKEDAYSVDR